MFAHSLHPWEAACGSGWRYGDHLVDRPSKQPVKTSTSPALIQAEGLETAARCNPWIPGRWADLSTPEVKWSAACDICCYTLLDIILLHWPLLRIITFSDFTMLIHRYWLLLHISTKSLLRIYTVLLLHHYRIIIALLHIIRHDFVLLHWPLLNYLILRC